MKLLRKIVIILLSFLLLIVIAGFGLSWYVSEKLPSILRGEKDFPYNVSYANLDIDLLSGSFTIQNAYLAPKDSLNQGIQTGAFGKIERIEVNNFSLLALLRKNQIAVSEVIIIKPDVTLFFRKEKYDPQKDFVKPFENTISTGKLIIKNGEFKMLDSLQKPSVKVANISFELTNIKVDSTTLKKDIPVRYRDYTLKCDSLFFDMGKHYTITANKLSTTDSKLSLENFRMTPKQSREQFTRMQPKELDQFNLSAKKISIPNLDWGYFRDTLYVHTPKITLDGIYANIYRSKEPADDYTRKKLYSEMLRSLKFDLDVKQFDIKNTIIEYEEQLTFSKPAAKVSFSKFDAKIKNIYSLTGHKNQKKLPATVLDVKCLFMKSSPLRVTWSFNIPDKSDAFTIMGHLQNIDAQKTDAITMPLMNARTDGHIKEVKFNFNGNLRHGSGPFAINYDDLKVDILKKDGKKENKLVSTIANTIVKNDSDDKLKETHVEVDRIQHKSVFNFLWRFTEQGLKQSVLPKTVVNIANNKKEKKDEKEKAKTKGKK
ncbi:hypothetical protein [Flavobacterium sp. AG291]|uniref:hypothetical protein n=1 Tax=Flavobacterium sp. AG291 TaxID=2184000 RepID=UPI000E0C1D6C|nr:hypothetical protein [Flavobacterium sp. AG291]RDI08292.1 hypothetical protein DEU42_111123 [Flavobacterium sp. AG291]